MLFILQKGAAMSASARRKIVEQYQTIEQLTARVRELEEENARLKAECDDIKQVQFPRKLEAVAVGWKKQLAASQLHAEQLREALESCFEKMRQMCLNGEWYDPDKAIELAWNALALPRDTSALDAYVSEKVMEAMK